MRVLESPQNVLTALDWFKAKLQFEQTPAGLHKMLALPTLLVLDVRDRRDYAREHIPGAMSLPLVELPGRLRELPRDKTIVTYSWGLTCALAPKAALDLAHRDYKVQQLAGGLERWKAEGFPTMGTNASTGG